jgi:hypothetical protein
MAIGTAGYTAMLCVLALEKAGITADRGDVLVTGAAGGVGSVAIALLDKLGYRVVASSRRGEQEGEAGAVDSLGSRTLANVLSQIKYGGAVAALGAGTRPAGDCPAVHPARRDACGRELGLDPAREARRGLGSSGDGPRPRKAQ